MENHLIGVVIASSISERKQPTQNVLFLLGIITICIIKLFKEGCVHIPLYLCLCLFALFPDSSRDTKRYKRNLPVKIFDSNMPTKGNNYFEPGFSHCSDICMGKV